MTIRKKLIASYIAIIIVPCILFMIAIGALFFSFAGKDQFINPTLFGEQAKVEHELFSKLKLMTTSEPEKLVDETYLQSVNKEFNEYNLYLLVRVNEEIAYFSEDIKSYPLTHYLTPFAEFKEHSHDFVTIDQKAFKFDQHDFYFPDQRLGSIFVIKEANAIEQFTTEFFGWLLILLLLILIGTYGTISYLVSRNIIHPLTALKDATEKIKAGDLNFKTDTKRKDEIGSLSASFEEMRVQLQKSVDMQLKYEENRKLLLSNISHDLKTPITSIKGYVEGIQDGIANSPEKLERYISTIYKKANDMDAMIDELFLFSKLDLKRIPFHFERTDILQYVEECVEDVALDLKGKNMKVEFVHSLEQPVFVSVDREKLMRVFSNIIANSVKYMDKERGVITLSVMVHENHVQITIKDNGSGISKESLPFIFDHFYRADQSRNSHKGGSGLGLAIARQIIEEHGGEIWANSNEKEGTEIHFTVKREQA